MSTFIPRPCWELRGKRGAYGLVFVGRNGENMFSNRPQGYVEKRDALHSLEVLYGAKAMTGGAGGWALVDPSGIVQANVRDATDKARAKTPEPVESAAVQGVS